MARTSHRARRGPTWLGAFQRASLVLLVLVALYAACGFLLAPWLAQRYGLAWLGERLGREVSIGEIRINPFLLTVEARGISVEGRHGRPMLAADRLFTDASLRGLLGGTWALDEVLLQGAQAHVVLEADGTLNLAQVARQWGRASEPSGSAPALQVQRLSVPDARVVFTDLGASQPASATIGPIDLQAANLSTTAGERATYELSAGLPQNGSLQSKGELAIQPSMTASGHVQLQGLQAQTLWPFLRDRLRLSELQGQAQFSSRFDLGPNGSLRLSGIDAAGSNVLVAGPGKDACMLRAARIAVHQGLVDPGERTARFGEVVLADGAACISVAPDGTLNWANLSTGRNQAANRNTEPSAGWSLEVVKVRLEGMDLRYAARGPGQPLTLDADRLNAELGIALSTAGPTQFVASEVQASWKGATLRMPGSSVPQVTAGATTLQHGLLDLASRSISARTLRVEAGKVAIVEAQTAARDSPGGRRQEAEKPWSVQLERVEVAGLGGRYSPEPGRPFAAVDAIDGNLKLALQVGGTKTQVLAGNINAAVRGLVLPGSGKAQPPLRLASGRIEQGSFDLAARRVGAAAVAVEGAVNLVRGRAGALEWPGLGNDGATSAGSREGKGNWRYAVDVLRVPALAVTLVDRTFEPALRLSGTLKGSAKHVASDRQSTFDAVASLAEGGTLQATGSAAPGAAGVQARVTAKAIALRPLQPVLDRFAALELRSGALSGSASVSYQAASGALRADGAIGIATLVLNEERSGDRFLSWKQLDVQGASFDLAARKLAAREVIVTQPGAKIAISQDRKVNLAQVFRRGGPAPAGATGRGEGERGFEFEVGSVRLRDGEVDFSDLSLVLPFSTTVKGLDGTIVELSSRPSQRAAVKAQGRIEPYGSASVEGSIVPTEPSRFTDLHVEFDNVLVPPFSPYTATFAGRKVQAGKLWLDLRYEVKQGELLGKNDIRLQDFRLGERVEAPNALDIPLDLAIALLRDASGEIRLSVPVTGELGNARFSVASAVRQALGNVLQRVVSAPFRALANLFGKQADSLAAIEFQPGTAELRPQELEKLDTLTRALRERPQLQLVVEAPYDPELDARVLQRALARRELAQALGRGAGAQEDPGPIAYDDPATRRELERMLRARAGQDAVEQLVARHAGDGDKRDQYRAMFERIAAAQPLPGTATQRLGIDRAEGIATYLERNGVDPSRVRTGSLASVGTGKDGPVTARLQVAAAAEGGR